MKRITAILVSALMCLSLISCKKNTPKEAEDTSKISYYINSRENTVYIYDGPKERFADWTFFNDYIDEYKVQRRIITSKAICTEVLTFANGEMTMTNGVYQVTDHTDKRNEPDTSDIVLLKEPLSLGASWVRSKAANDGIRTKVTGVDVPVTVPYGTFNALEVTTVYEEGEASEINYYVKDIGLIKTISVSGGVESVSVLSEIREEQGLAERTPIFFLNNNKDGIEYDIIDITYFSNANPSALYLEAAKQFISEKFNKTINENIKINSIKVEKENSKAIVDFNGYAKEELAKITDVKTQEMILQCAANYFGYIYKVENIDITIDGGAYQSIAVDIGNATVAQ